MRKRPLVNQVLTWMVLPAFALFTGFVVVPALSSIYYSLTSWDGLSPAIPFVGLRNYVDMVHDARFWNAFKNTLILTFTVTILENVVALALALLVDRVVFFRSFFRSIFYLPVLMSGIITGYVWVALLNYTFGVVNQVLNSLHLGFLVTDWLGNPRYALATLVFVLTWKGAGYYMVIYLAGLKAIPGELLEASTIDGARPFTQFRVITFPLLAGAVTINLTLSLISGMKVFDQIVAMTNGGPGFATETFTYEIYSVAFADARHGYGTALALALFAVTLVFATIQGRLLRRREVQM